MNEKPARRVSVGSQKYPSKSLLGRILAVAGALVILGTALFLGLFFAALTLGVLLLGGLFFGLRKKTAAGHRKTADRRPGGSVIDGEYSVVTKKEDEPNDPA